MSLIDNSLFEFDLNIMESVKHNTLEKLNSISFNICFLVLLPMTAAHNSSLGILNFLFVAIRFFAIISWDKNNYLLPDAHMHMHHMQLY